MLLQRISFENMFLYYFAKCYLHCICILIPGLCVFFLVCKCNHTGMKVASCAGKKKSCQRNVHSFFFLLWSLPHNPLNHKVKHIIVCLGL